MRTKATLLLLAVLAVFLGACRATDLGASVNREMSIVTSEADEHVALIDPHEALRKAVELIDQTPSRQDVSLEVYELGYPPLVSALEQAEKRGVVVRVIVDATERQSTATAPVLLAHKVATEEMHVNGGIDHVKLLVADGEVLTGGVNDGRYSYDTVDLDYLLSAPSVVQDAKTIFRQDWLAAGVGGGKSPANGVFGPFLVGRAIEPALLHDLSKVDYGWSCVAAENYLSDHTIRDALVAAARRGGSMRVVLNDETSEASSTLRALADIPVQVELAPRDPYLHAKVIACSGPSGQVWAVGGSANLSWHGMSVNHEIDVTFSGKAAKEIYEWASDLWAKDHR